jgi:hypothetical protein
MKVTDWLNKYGVIVIISLLVLVFLQTCGTRNNSRKTLKMTEKVYTKLDSINLSLNRSYIISKEEFEILLQINGLIISKRMLYDNNAIIRTIIRPDDQMNYYDTEIKKLEDQLNQLRANKFLKDK